MPWFKVDDNLGFHHKVIAAGNPAMGLWVRAGSVCAQQLTDGFVPDHLASVLGTKAQADKLVAAGLWRRVEGGYSFHEWAERQPSKADVEAERAAHAERMRAYRERKKAAKQEASSQVSGPRDAARTLNEQGTSAERAPLVQAPRPDPTRPDPTSSKSDRSRKRARQLPDDFRPSDKHIALAADLGVDLRREWPKFTDHHRAKGSTFKDWSAALNNWIRKAAEYGGATVHQFRPAVGDDGQPVLPPLPLDDKR